MRIERTLGARIIKATRDGSKGSGARLTRWAWSLSKHILITI